MRNRKKNWTQSELENNTYLENPFEKAGRWAELFGNSNPLYLEIGCGKGSFIVESAEKYCGINYIGLEKEPAVIAAAARLARERGCLPNLRFMAENAANLACIFAKDEISRIYLNFSDPWGNKKKWAKRRLTHSGFLAIYEQIMSDVELFLKTDDRQFFDFSVRELTERGYELSRVSYDLYSEPNNMDNIATEYERKFVKQGKPVHRLEARKQSEG